MTKKILPAVFLLLAASTFADNPFKFSPSEGYAAWADISIRMTANAGQILSGNILNACLTLNMGGSAFEQRLALGVSGYSWQFPLTKDYFMWSVMDLKAQFHLIGITIRKNESRLDDFLYLNLAPLRFRKMNGDTLWYPGAMIGNRFGVGFPLFAVQLDIRYTYNFRQKEFLSMDSLSFGLEIVFGGGKQTWAPTIPSH